MEARIQAPALTAEWPEAVAGLKRGSARRGIDLGVLRGRARPRSPFCSRASRPARR